MYYAGAACLLTCPGLRAYRAGGDHPHQVARSGPARPGSRRAGARSLEVPWVRRPGQGVLQAQTPTCVDDTDTMRQDEESLDGQ
eukprot:1147499-Pelagomonas_calceolata.AAC.9